VKAASPTAAWEPALATGLALTDRMLAGHLTRAVEVFGARALALVDMPPLGSERTESAQIAAAAALLWCREMEASGALPLIEIIAARYAKGEPWDLGHETSGRLLRFTQRDVERFGPSERAVLFRQAFEAPFYRDLASLIRDLALLGRSFRSVGVSGIHARIEMSLSNLATLMSQRGVGIVPFAARDIRADTLEAIALLRRPDLARALGGGSPVAIVARLAPEFLHRRIDASRAVARAEAAAVLGRLIADDARRGAAGTLDPTGREVRAAERWLAWEVVT